MINFISWAVISLVVLNVVGLQRAGYVILGLMAVVALVNIALRGLVALLDRRANRHRSISQEERQLLEAVHYRTRKS